MADVSERCYDMGRVVGDGNFAVVRECRVRGLAETFAMKIVDNAKLQGLDVWAMGVILFVLLGGFPPFRSPDRNQEELFRLIQKGEVHFLSPYWDNVSEGEILNSSI
uniref:Protein kinase domain-containing protein n=1 Tax=Sinocyclocheilus rhinocerous TaxID=307959 RepID=A0A673LVX0_9TELE